MASADFSFPVLFFLLLVPSIFITLLIVQPFQSSLVRLRANYLPKAIRLELDEENGQTATFAQGDAKIGPVVRGVWEMALRTRRIEGWIGLWKGFTPTAIQMLVISTFSMLWMDASAMSPHTSYRTTPSSPGAFWKNMLFLVIVTVVAIPLSVITYRTITHPTRLPWTTPRANLRALLTPAEFYAPWSLYTLPGLLPATLAHVCWVGLVGRVIRNITVPGLAAAAASRPFEDESGTDRKVEVSYIGLFFFLLFQILSTGILAPLEVLMIRLAVQRPSGPPSPSISSYSHQASAAAEQGANGDAGGPTPSPSFHSHSDLDADYSEPVIELRPSASSPALALAGEGEGGAVERYEGMLDAARKIKDEEGIEALYRGAWVTLLGTVTSAFS